MSLIERIINCSNEELDSIIKSSLEEKNNSSNNISALGFTSSNVITIFNGFIPFNTRIKYSNFSMSDYSMKTTDFYFEFARLLRKNKIQNKGQFISLIEPFINNYFGINKTSKDLREQILNDRAFKTTTTDEEYFNKLENNEIGNLKGTNAAMCTEKSALAQNLLSLFDFESYYVMGCINNNGKDEAHCFNITKAKDSYILLDYSVPVPLISDNKVVGYTPFQGKIDNDELEQVISNGQIKEFQNYQYIKEQDKYKKVPTDTIRSYIVGSFELKQTSPKI